MSTYHGWATWETWSLVINLDTNEDYYNAAQENAKNGPLILEDWFKTTFVIKGTDSCYKIYDEWTDRDLRAVDWQEIVDYYKEV